MHQQSIRQTRPSPEFFVRACDVGCPSMVATTGARLFSSATTKRNFSQQSTASAGKLSHVNKDGSLPNMVDVGHKAVTKRTARARSIVDLPEHVYQALASTASSDTGSVVELSGAKGPIITTAIIAGGHGGQEDQRVDSFLPPSSDR